MPNFYYSNPSIGVGISNLAQAMLGNPLQDVQAGLLGDRRRTEQVQRRNLEAEALSREMRNREHDAYIASVPSTVASIVGQLPEATRPGASAALEYALRAGDGSNAEQFMDAITRALSGGLAQGDDTAMRQSLVMQGKMPGTDFAGTADRADEITNNKYAADLTKAMQVENADNAAAMAREQFLEEGRNARAKAEEAGRNTRANADRAASGSKQPRTVGGSDAKAILDLLDDQVVAAGGMDSYLDPATRSALLTAIASLYQQSGNLPAAVQQGWTDVMGLAPATDTEGRFNPFVANRTRVSPGSGVADAVPQAPDAAAVLEQARQAIAAGRDPRLVRQRLQEMGVDPSGL